MLLAKLPNTLKLVLEQQKLTKLNRKITKTNHYLLTIEDSMHVLAISK